MEKLEKFIYSFKYLPPILYFGSVGLILLDIFLDIELIGDKLIIPLWILFFYMSYLGSKNYKSGDFNVLEKFIYRDNNLILTDKVGYPQFYTQLVFEKNNPIINIKTVINDEESLSKISTCKKVEVFEKES